MARITPAGAGKTFSSKRSNANCEDHPRRCGENAPESKVHPLEPGSPPQVRGKPAYCWTAGTAPRITPAGAGKTNQRRQRHEQQQDHPRRCGENLSVLSTSTPSRGSPPQVRGKLSNSSKTLLTNRITPAGAGKTSFSYHAMRRSRDHPRRCGENRTDCYDVRLRKGSPPQVRGKLLLMRKQGKQKWDHPRRCGENKRSTNSCRLVAGSPPQVRGKL